MKTAYSFSLKYIHGYLFICIFIADAHTSSLCIDINQLQKKIYNNTAFIWYSFLFSHLYSSCSLFSLIRKATISSTLHINAKNTTGIADIIILLQESPYPFLKGCFLPRHNIRFMSTYPVEKMSQKLILLFKTIIIYNIRISAGKYPQYCVLKL